MYELPIQAEKKVIVYLFTGFLESGKTTFIQNMLENKRYDNGKKTLLLLCEEGEREYDSTKFAVQGVEAVSIDDETEFTRERLLALAGETGAERILCEYNGMWRMNTFFSALPESWTLFQVFFFADAHTIMRYNENMRQLTYDKLQKSQLVVFNRFTPDMDLLAFHKLVRCATTKAQIVFEAPDGTLTYDTIKDTLPYDLSDPVVQILDTSYAVWYRDLMEHTENYTGKTMGFTAYVPPQEDPTKLLVGRHVMVCCEADIQFQTLVCTFDETCPKPETSGEWVHVIATVEHRPHNDFGGGNMLLNVKEITTAREPEQVVATFD